jgi:ferric-dicitrate binding protein FerR (iron transport regulator)
LGAERKVELSGEAYFEVAKNLQQPFKVQTVNQVVEVLGTHFNINSYADEPSVRTTLLEGAVKVLSNKTGDAEILKPGQQSTLSQNTLSVVNVDAEKAVAWKNGLFDFNGSDIQSVMRQFSRWYNVVVEFEGKVPDIKLWGKVYRNENASEALALLGHFNLKYRLEEKGGVEKVIILK